MSYTDPAGIVLVKGVSSCKAGTEVNLDIWLLKQSNKILMYLLDFG